MSYRLLLGMIWFAGLGCLLAFSVRPCLATEARQQTRLHAIHSIMGSDVLADNSAAFLRRAAHLPSEQRYVRLKGWVLPGPEHPEAEHQQTTVYHIYVEDSHNYAVGDGEWLVHNAHQADDATDELRMMARKIADSDPVIPMRSRRTIAVIEASDGSRYASSGTSSMSDAQRAAAKRLGVEVIDDADTLGHHAEQRGIFGMIIRGITPRRGGTSNIICGEFCRPFLEELGAIVGKFGFLFP